MSTDFRSELLDENSELSRSDMVMIRKAIREYELDERFLKVIPAKIQAIIVNRDGKYSSRDEQAAMRTWMQLEEANRRANDPKPLPAQTTINVGVKVDNTDRSSEERRARTLAIAQRIRAQGIPDGNDAD